MFGSATKDRHDRIDWLLLLALLGLMLLGAAFIYSATMANESTSPLPWYTQTYLKQIIWYVVGLTGAIAITFVDYRILSRWSYVFFWVAIGLLVTVLIFGKTVNGARRWFSLGFFQFQPSEFAKLAFIFALGSFLSRPADELRFPHIFWKAVGMIALPFVLIMKEPDLGSALVLLPTGTAMLFVAGTPRRFLMRLGGTLGILAALFLVDILFAPPGWWQIKLEEYQRHRLLVYFGADFAPMDATPAQMRQAEELQRQKSYQVRQALISVGSGGWLGKGWRQGQQTLGFLPRGAAHNDFIFSVIAKEEGFVGSVMVLTLYSVILFFGIRIASQARDRLGKLLAVGVVTLFFSHVFINIGMNIRIMPVTGVPLPLLSYGGSSVLCSLIAIGLLQNVHTHRKSY